MLDTNGYRETPTEELAARPRIPYTWNAMSGMNHSSRSRTGRLRYGKPIFLAIAIGAFNQLSGINAILYYLNNIFAAAGFSRLSSNRQAVAIGVNEFVSNISGHGAN